MALVNYKEQETYADNHLIGDEEEQVQAQDYFSPSDMAKLVKTYLEEDVPTQIKKTSIYTEFWAVLGKTIKLTFLQPEDIDMFEAMFDVCRANYMMSKPTFEYGFDDMMILDQLRVYFVAACKRASGFSGARYNERMILGSQIHQNITDGGQGRSTSGGGFFGGIKRFFGA